METSIWFDLWQWLKGDHPPLDCERSACALGRCLSNLLWASGTRDWPPVLSWVILWRPCFQSWATFSSLAAMEHRKTIGKGSPIYP